MRALLIIVSLCFTLAAFAQADSGIANKAKAKHQIINGLKEGVWIEYMDAAYNATKDSNAPYFSLVNYKAGVQSGVIIRYYKSGKLWGIVPCTTYGNKNGLVKVYYESGKLEGEVPYTNDKINGVEKVYFNDGAIKAEIQYKNDTKNGVEINYFENGKLASEIPWKDGIMDGSVKEYYEDGGIKSETVIANDSVISTRQYDEKGNEIFPQ